MMEHIKNKPYIHKRRSLVYFLYL